MVTGVRRGSFHRCGERVDTMPRKRTRWLRPHTLWRETLKW
ncbi:hypothetical protein A8924_5384 [Saccharopolyspora erythraea NRRL 2338]|nr:hypothetical protein A8924_5384 [Saccharopolyspora erythraea NRRL 2338]